MQVGLLTLAHDHMIFYVNLLVDKRVLSTPIKVGLPEGTIGCKID